MPQLELEDFEHRRDIENELREIKSKFLIRKKEIIEIICECFSDNPRNYDWDNRIFISLPEYDEIISGNDPLFHHGCGISRNQCKLSQEKNYDYFFPYSWFYTPDEEIRSSLLRDIAIFQERKRTISEERRIKREQKRSKKEEILEKLSPEERKIVGLIKKRKKSYVYG